jgi:glycosyltransferase involved in cell wall biosynthesis
MKNNNLYYFGYYCAENDFNYISQKHPKIRLSRARQNLEGVLLKELKGGFDRLFVFSFLPFSKRLLDETQRSGTPFSISYFFATRFNALFLLVRVFFKMLRIPKRSTFLFYSCNPFFVLPALLLKPFKKFQLSSICSEVPQFRRNGSKIKRLLQKKLNRRFDSYILLSEQMALAIPVKQKPYIVMEGISSSAFSKPLTKMERTNNLVYAGGLYPDNCLLQMIEAVQLSNAVSSFDVYGSGPLAEKIALIAQQDKRIHFFGLCPRDLVLQAEQKASAVMLIRAEDSPTAMYAFPSKLIEYLASGTITICSRMPCIPSAYYSHIITPDSINPEDIAAKIDFVLNMKDEDYVAYATAAQRFISSEKNASVQVGKIIIFLQEHGKE